MLPTYRSLKFPDYPIEDIGMQPDVYLDDTAGDWLTYAVQYLEDI